MIIYECMRRYQGDGQGEVNIKTNTKRQRDNTIYYNTIQFITIQKERNQSNAACNIIA